MFPLPIFSFSLRMKHGTNTWIIWGLIVLAEHVLNVT